MKANDHETMRIKRSRRLSPILFWPFRLLVRLFGKVSYLLVCLVLMLVLNLGLLISDEFYDLTKYALSKAGSMLGREIPEYVPRRILIKQNDDLNDNLKKSQKHAAGLDEKLKVSQKHVAELDKTNTRLTHEKNALTDENRHLLGRIQHLENQRPKAPIRSSDVVDSPENPKPLPDLHHDVTELDAKEWQRAKELNKRLVQRSLRSITADVSSAGGEALPVIGAVFVAAATAWEVGDTCFLLEDMRELEMLLNGEPTGDIPRCGYTPYEISQYLLGREPEQSCREKNQNRPPELRLNCPPEGPPELKPTLNSGRGGVILPSYD